MSYREDNALVDRIEILETTHFAFVLRNVMQVEKVFIIILRGLKKKSII